MPNDLRLALRSLAKAPGFTAIIVFTLAVGIGANTAIFSFFHGILLRPLPFADAETLVQIKRGPRHFGDMPGDDAGLQTADYLDLLAAPPGSFSALTAYNTDGATLTGCGAPSLTYGAIVPANFFDVLGSRATVGRTFSTNAAAGSTGRLAVLGHGFWQTRFGGDPAIIGQSITLNGVNFTVTGIMPADFDLPRWANYWVTPAGPVPESIIGTDNENANGRGDYLRTVVGRLTPGVSIGQAEQEIIALVQRLPNPTNTSRAVYLMNLRDQSVGSARKTLGVVLAGVVLVLLIACLNIGNLMLARATTRQRELSIRLALGANRWQISRQLLAESLVLASLGGAASLLFSWWGVNLLFKIVPWDTIPRLAAVHIDLGVLTFAFILSLLTGVICGLAPIISSNHLDLSTATKSGGDRGDSGRALPRRLRATLVSGEVAFSLILLVSTGLLLRSFREMVATSWGFEPSHVTVLQVKFAGGKWTEPAKSCLFYRRLMTGLSAQPAFESVALSLDKIGGAWWHLAFTPEGQVFAKPEDRPTANFHLISPGYFRTLGIPLAQGRDFTADDAENTPAVAIIDATIARKYFPAGRAIGQRLQIEGSPTVEIVGVAGDVKVNGPEAADQPAIYAPFLQQPAPGVFVSVRSELEFPVVGKMIQQIVNGIDAGSPTTDLGTMSQVIESPARNRRFPLILISVFSSFALLLAGVGIYGVTAYGVAQRTRELGVRLALGASPGGLVRLVVRQGFRPIAIGLALGMTLAALTAYLMRGLLYRVQPLDLQTFVFVPLLLAGIALIACWLPARRVARVNPIDALRAE